MENNVYKLLSVRARLARRQRALEQRPAVGLRSFLQGQRKRYSCSRPPALADCDGRAATIQRTMYHDNHRRTVALIDDRRTAQRGDARACCRGGPCEAGCTLGQTVRTILSLGNIDASVSGTYSPLHNRLDLGLWGSGAFGTSVFPMGNIYAYVLRCPS